MTTNYLTYWNKVIPTVDVPNVEEHLAARVRDPLWMLTRQWQVGEFQGEDAGSAAFVKVETVTAPLASWRPYSPGGSAAGASPVPTNQPLELSIEGEHLNLFEPGLRVEIGEAFELCLVAAGASGGVVDAFRKHYPMALDGELQLSGKDLPHNLYSLDSRDLEGNRFLRVCGNRAIDGVLLYYTFCTPDAMHPAVPPAVGLSGADLTAATTAMNQFIQWFKDVYQPNCADTTASSWQANRLEYSAELMAKTPYQVPGLSEWLQPWNDGSQAAWVLSTNPSRDGDIDWHSFDLKSKIAVADLATYQLDGTKGAAKTTDLNVFPMHVQFRGMPNERWWDFESSVVDFGAIEPEKRDLAKLMVMDFMLVQSNDWFSLPIEMDRGTVCFVNYVLVQDVFGGQTVIQPAVSLSMGGTSDWRMFTPKFAGNPGSLFILPPSAGAATIESAPIEEVHFLRDNVAEMAWAIEATTPNAVGAPWSGYERSVAGNPPSAPPAPPASTEPPAPADIPLQYLLETTVPENWIPFVPVGDGHGKVLLTQAAMERVKLNTDGSKSIVTVPPLGRLLSGGPLALNEEELPREGVVVSRVVCRTRWSDGSTRTWIRRRKGPGLGEGQSGLAYDLATIKK